MYAPLGTRKKSSVEKIKPVDPARDLESVLFPDPGSPRRM
jgi:hypothetical protein